jgi:hypothetical protein
MKITNDQWKFMMKYREELNNFYNQYDYDWFCSLNLPNYNVENSEKFLKRWRCNLSTKDHIQIGYLGIIVTSKFTGPHIHLLLFGRNKNGDTLLNRDKKEWEREWTRITGRGSLIEDYEDNGVVRYMSLTTNTPVNHFELVKPYNKNLLEEFRKNN